MPTGRLTMRRIRDVLRLRFAQGLSERAIATSLGLGKGSVGTYLRRARDAGLAWPLPEGLDDDALSFCCFQTHRMYPIRTVRFRIGRRWTKSCAGAA